VDVVAGGRDVLEDPREIALALQQQLDARDMGRGERDRLVAALDLGQGHELGGLRHRTGRSDGPDRGGSPAGDRPPAAVPRRDDRATDRAGAGDEQRRPAALAMPAARIASFGHRG
jgi:hypothetical protein